MWRRSLSRPGLRGLPSATQRSREEPPFQARVVKPEYLDLDRAALQRARQDVAAHGRHRDRPAAHAAGIVDQQRHHRVAEIGVALAFVGQRDHRVGHHAGQPAGVEHALLEVEIPRARLLGHQPALQPIGELRDHALQVLQLLVELLAQAGQLGGVTEVLGADLLVELPGEGAVRRLDIGGRALARRLRAARPVVALGGLVALLGVLGILALGRLALHLLGLGGQRALGLALAVALAFLLLVLLAGLVRSLLALVGLLRLGVDLRLGQIHRREQFARRTGEGVLVGASARHLGHRRLRLRADRLAPQRQHAGHAGRVGGARHPLAREQAERGGHRQLVAPGHAVVSLGLALLGQARAQIGRDPAHPVAAHHLAAHLLERVVHVAGLALARHARGVHRVVVMAQPQGHAVGRPAQPGHLGRRQGSGGQGQARALAAEAGGAGLEGDRDVRLPRHRPQRAGRGALEILRPRGVAGAALVLRGGSAHRAVSSRGGPDPALVEVPAASSAFMQRW